MTGEDHDLLLRLEQKVDFLCDKVKNFTLALNSCKDHASDTFVTKKEFSPVQKLVYGSASIILTTVVVAVISLVLIHTKGVLP